MYHVLASLGRHLGAACLDNSGWAVLMRFSQMSAEAAVISGQAWDWGIHVKVTHSHGCRGVWLLGEHFSSSLCEPFHWTILILMTQQLASPWGGGNLKNKRGNCSPLYDLAAEITQCHLCNILLVNSWKGLHRTWTARGKGHWEPSWRLAAPDILDIHQTFHIWVSSHRIRVGKVKWKPLRLLQLRQNIKYNMAS